MAPASSSQSSTSALEAVCIVSTMAAPPVHASCTSFSLAPSRSSVVNCACSVSDASAALAWASSRARIAATAAVFFARSAFGEGALDEARRHELGGEASSTPPASCAMRTVRVRGFTVVIGSDKGGLVFGGSLDFYNSYAQRGNLQTVESVMEAACAMVPAVSRVKVLRAWGGVMDMSMVGSPIIDRTPVDNLYLNCGWCYGGFKATPASGWCFAHLLATGETHELARAFRLDRFSRGYQIDETGHGAQANLH